MVPAAMDMGNVWTMKLIFAHPETGGFSENIRKKEL
jgi:hypothetical protein